MTHVNASFLPSRLLFPLLIGALAGSSLAGCSGDDSARGAVPRSTSQASSGSGGSGGGAGGASTSDAAATGGGGAGGSGGADGAASSASSGGAGGSGGGELGSSHGAGGIVCEKQGDLDVEAGAAPRQYCLAREGGVEFRFAMPIAPSGPLTIGLYVHGDGAGAYRSNSAIETLLPWADAHDAIMVAARAPNGCAWWLRPDYACPSDPTTPVNEATDRDLAHANADALDAVLKKIRASYDITNGPLFYYGSSGGSVFLTSSFIPKYGDVYPGAFAINCGGEVPAPGSIGWDFTDASKRGPSKLWFTYGDQDFLLADEQAAVAYYQGQGFSVYEQVLPGKGHCEFDGHGRALEVWKEYLGE